MHLRVIEHKNKINIRPKSYKQAQIECTLRTKKPIIPITSYHWASFWINHFIQFCSQAILFLWITKLSSFSEERGQVIYFNDLLTYHYRRSANAQKALEYLDLAKRCGMRFPLAEAHRLLGENYLETDPSRAESHFTKSLDIYKEIEAKNELAKTYNGFGLLCKHQGQITRARGYFKEALDIFDLIGISKESEKIKNELAALPEK
jgi:tetratricopeptide (TPR) repeat protein